MRMVLRLCNPGLIIIISVVGISESTTGNDRNGIRPGRREAEPEQERKEHTHVHTKYVCAGRVYSVGVELAWSTSV